MARILFSPDEFIDAFYSEAGILMLSLLLSLGLALLLALLVARFILRPLVRLRKTLENLEQQRSQLIAGDQFPLPLFALFDHGGVSAWNALGQHEWTHIAVTQSTDSLKIYTNGTLAEADTNRYDPSSTSPTAGRRPMTNRPPRAPGRG